jgi:SAM-dependent methyltransferase
MEWTEGYASDVEYTANFYREQSPDFLNCACILHGVEPVALDKPYTYFELGCGQGLTVNILAASNPLGNFYAVDFMPSHIAGACQLADAAKLDNLVLLENSFAELANGDVADLPQFDFITMHGVYTWINAENQKHIIAFISRYLKPGGIVYVSYNAMPGWTVEIPLKRLLREHANLYPNRNDIQLRQATAFLEQFDLEQGGYFSNTPALKELLKLLKTRDPRYLAHEYLHVDACPLYHLDVVQHFASAKLDYVGSADWSHVYPSLYLNEQKLELINAVPHAALRETLKDFLINSYFRKDIFVRGARQLTEAKQREWLQQMKVVLIVPRSQVKFADIKAGVATIDINEELYSPVLDEIEENPHSLAEITAFPVLHDRTVAEITKTIVMLAVSNQVALYFDRKNAVQPAQRMNQVLAKEACYSDIYDTFASPLLGNGFSMNIVERLVYFVVNQPALETDITIITTEVQRILVNRGRRLRKNGKFIESDEENLAEIALHVAATLADKLPVWCQLELM